MAITSYNWSFSTVTSIANLGSGNTVENVDAVAMGDGTLITTWTGLGGDEVLGRGLYGQNTAFTVNSTTTGQQFGQTLGALTNGGFVAAFSDTSSGSTDVRFRMYDAQRVAGSEVVAFGAGTTNAFDQSDVVGLSAGGFALASRVTIGSSSDIAVRFYNSSGTALTSGDSTFSPETDTAINSSNAALARLTNGEVILTYVETAVGGTDTDIYMQRYTAAGAKSGSRILVDGAGTRNFAPSIAALSDGGFAIVYEDNENGVSGSLEISLRIYNANGTLRGTQITANTSTQFHQQLPSIASIDDAGMVVSWKTSGTIGGFGNVTYQMFNLSGGGLGAPTTTSGSQGVVDQSELVQIGDGTFGYVDRAQQFGQAGSGRLVRTIQGDSTPESLNGDGLADVINGDFGDDTINGGLGNDTIDGGAGNDQLFGGEGTDTLSYDGAAARTVFAHQQFVFNGVTYLRMVDQQGSLGSDLTSAFERAAFTGSTQGFAGVQQNDVSNMDGGRFDDLVFTNQTTGQTFTRDFNGGGTPGAWGNVFGTLAAGWRVFATGDATGDFRADVFVQNTNNGGLYFYNLANTSWSTINANITSEWQALAAKDFTGDGGIDALIRNVNTGFIMYADMSATGAFEGWGNVANLGTGWRAVGAGDFDKDGFADVAVQRVSDGLTYYVDLNAGAFAGWGFISGPVGTDWQAREVADLNGDGYADVVYHNETTDQLWWVDMAGGSNSAWKVVSNNIGAYSVTGVADVLNDGVMDVVVRSAANGDTLVANMTNAGFGGWIGAGGAGADFVVV